MATNRSKPVFGPPRPPHLQQTLSDGRRVGHEADFASSGDDDAIHDAHTARPSIDLSYPPDGKWRRSKGFYEHAMRPKPYAEGGSPFQTYSRNANGNIELGHSVDPQYLRDTGMTFEEAMKGPSEAMGKIMGLSADASTEDKFEWVSKASGASESADGRPTAEGICNIFEAVIEKGGVSRESLLRTMKQARQEGKGIQAGDEDYEVALNAKIAELEVQVRGKAAGNR